MKVLIFFWVRRPERIRYDPVHGLRDFDLSTLNRKDHDVEEFSIDELSKSEWFFVYPIYPRNTLLVQAFHTEKPSWRAVIQYNIVRSVRIIVEAMTDAQASNHSSESGSSSYTSHHNRQESRTPKGILDYPQLTAEHQTLKMRLSPLVQIEESLIRKLTLSGAAEYLNDGRNYAKEVTVNSTLGWKNAFSRLVRDGRDSVESDLLIDWDDPNDPGVVLNACADDIKRLWHDPVIQRLLDVRKLRVEEVAGL
jgi:guanine nucleotide-binding protein subunit alpha